MLRNVFAALAAPVSYGMVKYGATASLVTYAEHLTTSLNTHSFNKPTLMTLRFSAKVVDVLSSAVYNYYFRTELQELGKTMGHYVEAYSPALIDKTLTHSLQFGKNYLVPITKSVIENTNYYVTPYGVYMVTLISDVAAYTLSSRFVSDVRNFKDYLHDGTSINLYHLATDSAILTHDFNIWLHEGSSINLFVFAEESIYLALILNAMLHDGLRINLYTIIPDLTELAQAIIDFTLQNFINLYTNLIYALNELNQYHIDLTILIEKWTALQQTFIDIFSTPALQLYLAGLELYNQEKDLTFLAIYFDQLATKLLDIYNYSVDLTPEQLLNQLELWKIAILEWLDEPFDLTLEQVLEQINLLKEDLIAWWNEPTNFKEIASAMCSTYAFKIIFIASGKIILEDRIQSTFSKLILTGVIINEVGEALRKAAEDAHHSHLAQNNLKTIDNVGASDTLLLTQEAPTVAFEHKLAMFVDELPNNKSAMQAMGCSNKPNTAIQKQEQGFYVMDEDDLAPHFYPDSNNMSEINEEPSHFVLVNLTANFFAGECASPHSY